MYISSLVLFCSCNIDVIDLRILMKGATDALDFLQCLSIFRKRKPSLSPKGVPWLDWGLTDRLLTGTDYTVLSPVSHVISLFASCLSAP